MHLFGLIENGEMILNKAGEMVKKWYFELENKYPDKRCHEMVVMPNHIHCILENTDGLETDVRMSPCGHPKRRNANKKHTSHLGNAVGWFKTMTTNEYIRGVKQLNWQRFNKRVWQLNYYERIVRSEQAFINITRYIQNNRKNWTQNRMNLQKKQIFKSKLR
jgi:REP element-mobilizing transposase RayT